MPAAWVCLIVLAIDRSLVHDPRSALILGLRYWCGRIGCATVSQEHQGQTAVINVFTDVMTVGHSLILREKHSNAGNVRVMPKAKRKISRGVAERKACIVVRIRSIGGGDHVWHLSLSRSPTYSTGLSMIIVKHKLADNRARHFSTPAVSTRIRRAGHACQVGISNGRLLDARPLKQLTALFTTTELRCLSLTLRISVSDCRSDSATVHKCSRNLPWHTVPFSCRLDDLLGGSSGARMNRTDHVPALR